MTVMKVPITNDLITTLAVKSKVESYLRGGCVHFRSNGSHFLAWDGEAIACVTVADGTVAWRVGTEDGDPVGSAFVLTPDDESLITSHKSGLLRLWKIQWVNEGEKEEKGLKPALLAKTWKAYHSGPISILASDPTSTLIASGASDNVLKIWDIFRHYCTHSLKGCQGIFTFVRFHPTASTLYAAARDNVIRAWDLTTSKVILELSGHVSAVTDLQFLTDNSQQAISCGRDSVILLWHLSSANSKVPLKTIPVRNGALEALRLLPATGNFKIPGVRKENLERTCLALGESGELSAWDLEHGTCVYRATLHEGPLLDLQIIAEQNLLSVVSAECCVILISCKMKRVSQFVGNNDDILSALYFPITTDNDDVPPPYIIGTNGSAVQLYTTDLKKNSSFLSCQLLKCHSGAVLASACWTPSSNNIADVLLVTVSKDMSAVVWRGSGEKVASVIAHTGAVNTVVTSKTQLAGSFPADDTSTTWFVTGSEDRTVKIWSLETGDDGTPAIKGTGTVLAHEKSVNCVDVSPNDRLIASGSQDRILKLWKVPDLTLLGSFRGHKRGIWDCRFSPSDQVLASASTDATVKLWSLSDFRCLKTFDEHESSVLCVRFLSRGLQLLTSGSDGLVKLWCIKTMECLNTFDEHDGKVWALAVSADEKNFISGGGGALVRWRDDTAEQLEKKRQENKKKVEEDQRLSNLLHDGKLEEALALAINLNRPHKTLSILTNLWTNSAKLHDAVLNSLAPDLISSLIGFAVRWNSTSKSCHVAQRVLAFVLGKWKPDDLLRDVPQVRTNLEGLLAYSQRHFQRLSKQNVDLCLIDFLIAQMKITDTPSLGLEKRKIVAMIESNDQLKNKKPRKKTVQAVEAAC